MLTALRCEYEAVRAHLGDVKESVHRSGMVYEKGTLTADAATWSVAIAEVGAGIAGAAVEAERALTSFEPDVILFVGIAGGVKDVAVGDVVVADKVYGYERGRDIDDGLRPRPDVQRSSFALLARARAEARKPEWGSRASGSQRVGSDGVCRTDRRR